MGRAGRERPSENPADDFLKCTKESLHANADRRGCMQFVKVAKPLKIQRFGPKWHGNSRQLGKFGFFFGKRPAYTCPCVNDTGFSRARRAREFSQVIRGDASEATGTAADASPQTEKSRDAYPLAGNDGQNGWFPPGNSTLGRINAPTKRRPSVFSSAFGPFGRSSTLESHPVHSAESQRLIQDQGVQALCDWTSHRDWFRGWAWLPGRPGGRGFKPFAKRGE